MLKMLIFQFWKEDTRNYTIQARTSKYRIDMLKMLMLKTKISLLIHVKHLFAYPS